MLNRAVFEKSDQTDRYFLFRQRVIQAAMRGQRVVERACRCWNLALWVLVSLLGFLLLVVVSVLQRHGERPKTTAQYMT